jgi:hypothetical protein
MKLLVVEAGMGPGGVAIEAVRGVGFRLDVTV